MFNNLLDPKACESQETACDIESLDMLYFQGKYIVCVLINICFKLENSIFITFLHAQLVNTSPSSYFDPKCFV